MARSQKTIASPVSLLGTGLHTSAEVEVSLRPAEAGTGVVFIRTDLEGKPRVRATVEAAENRDRRTLLRQGEAEVHTVEHLLACLMALGIDNLLVEVSGVELPGLDGSSRQYLELIEKAGIEELDEPRPEFRVEEEIAVDLPGEDVTIVALPGKEGLRVSYILDYKAPGIPLQRMSLTLTPESFATDIAPARTFCLESEAEALREAGLGRGADYRNTLVVGEDGSPIENELRFPDEYVRHKILDLIGDLFLAGFDIRGKLMASRSGHVANVELVRRLRQRYELRRKQEEGPEQILDIREVMRILPHRYPFLLIDRVVEIDGYQRAVGIKNVSINEPFFQGHWPEQPVMPGVLIVEAMAQLSGVLLLRKLEHTGKLAVLLSIDHVKLRRAVVPGDQLRVESLAENVKPRTGRVLCRATVGGKLAAQARIKFMLVDAG